MGCGIPVMFFGCEEAGWEGMIGPLELSWEGETGSLSSYTLFPTRRTSDSHRALLQRVVFLRKRGRDFEFDGNFLNRNRRNVPHDWGTKVIEDPLNYTSPASLSAPRSEIPPFTDSFHNWRKKFHSLKPQGSEEI